VDFLILGETAVGISTFINALLNYLSFKTLKDAMEGDFHCAIKATFGFYHQDSTEEDWICNHIKIKPNVAVSATPDDDEHDILNGRSAT
jgi:hypothetical protein